MAKISVKTEVAASADALWTMIGRFNTLGEWHPMVTKSETEGQGKGAMRQIKLMSGGSLVERLEHTSDVERVYIYSIVDSPVPVADWVAEIRVRDLGNGTSTVEWSSNYTPLAGKELDAMKAIHEMFQTGVDNLKKIFSR